MQLELTPLEWATLQIALCGWKERCAAEARMMEGLAADFAGRPSADKARRNAAASREFMVDAERLLMKIREAR